MPEKSKEQLRKERQYKATTKYKAKTYKQVKIELHLKKDADIIEAIEKQTNKCAFIKACIREQLKKES